MELSPHDLRLIEALKGGLPLTPRPYAAVGAALGMAEDAVIARIRRLTETGVFRRFGVIVRHRELGYRANAMVVWDVPDPTVDAVGRAMAQYGFVTLCYRRPRRPPDWPYNLYCMIHGTERDAVLDQAATLARELGLEDVPHRVLFSGRRFKQRGADYGRLVETAA
jgi:DNA-binding Lrp family transcriptional regulator